MQLSSKAKRSGGFTLTELLIVVAIISIVLTMAANMLRGADKAKGLQSGVDLLANTIAEAREIAKGQATWTRVAIPYLPDDRSLQSRHLHYAAVMVWQSQDPMDLTQKPMGNDAEWIMPSKGIEFPSGVYFDPQLSVTEHDPDIRNSGQSIKTKPFQAQLSSGKPTPCFYIEFDRQGRMTWPRGATKLVLVSGVVRPDGTIIYDPKDGDKPAQASGVIIFPNGQMSSLRNKKQVFGDL